MVPSVDIAYRVGRARECMPTRSAWGKSRLIAAVNYQSGKNRVCQRPQRRREPGLSLVELSVTIKLSGELQLTVNDMGERQIELLIPVEAPLRPANQKLAGIEIQMKLDYIFARQKCEDVVHVP